jgi:hypothetical protein
MDLIAVFLIATEMLLDRCCRRPSLRRFAREVPLLNRGGGLESGMELALHRPVPITPDALFTDEESKPVGSNAYL